VRSRFGLILSAARFRLDDGLLDPRSRESRRIAERIRIDGDAPPTNDRELLGLTCLFEQPPSAASLRISVFISIVREENRGDAKRHYRFGAQSSQLQPIAVERLRQCQQDPGPVS